MVNYLAKMRRKLALGPFFTVFIGADQRNSIQNTIQVSDYHKTKKELNPLSLKTPATQTGLYGYRRREKSVCSVISITFFFVSRYKVWSNIYFYLRNAKRELNHFCSYNLVVNYSTLFIVAPTGSISGNLTSSINIQWHSWRRGKANLIFIFKYVSLRFKQFFSVGWPETKTLSEKWK